MEIYIFRWAHLSVLGWHQHVRINGPARTLFSPTLGVVTAINYSRLPRAASIDHDSAVSIRSNATARIIESIETCCGNLVDYALRDVAPDNFSLWVMLRHRSRTSNRSSLFLLYIYISSLRDDECRFGVELIWQAFAAAEQRATLFERECGRCSSAARNGSLAESKKCGMFALFVCAHFVLSVFGACVWAGVQRIDH